MPRLATIALASIAIALASPCHAALAKRPDPPATTEMPPESDPMVASMMEMYRPIEVSRMTDSELSCEELFAESGYLDGRIAAMPKPVDPMVASQKMQDDLRKKMQGQQRKARAGGLASSLLSMVPSVGGIAGGLAASAMRPNMGDMMPDTSAFMADMQKSAMQSRALSELQARKAHVTNLFLDRSCKVSTLDQAKVASAMRKLDGTAALDSATPALPASLPAADGADSPSKVAPTPES